MNKRYFITGIGTNVGKTVASAILTEALEADYWKPIQSGNIEGTDRQTVLHLISNTKTVCFTECYNFKAPLSPNMAAALEAEEINLDKIQVPITNNTALIIEGAGGILVPLNQEAFVIDLAHPLNAEIILVVSNYLGCINHTLLSLNYLLSQSLPIKGIILNGYFSEDLKATLLHFIKVPVLAHIPELSELNKESIHLASRQINKANFL